MDKSLEGVSFLLESEVPLTEREDIVISASDSQGNRYNIEAFIIRTSIKSGEYFCGAQFRMTLASFPEAVGFVFGDSQNWVSIWEDTKRMGGTLRIISHLFGKGFKGCLLCFPMLIASALGFLRSRLFPLVKSGQST